MEELTEYKKKFCDLRYGKKWQPYRSDVLRIDAILKLVKPGSRVLDVGCGDGTIGESLRVNNNDVYGVDISAQAVTLALERGIKASVCDIENDNLPFPEKTFDFVVAAEIIEHVFDTDGFLGKIRNVLKTGGCLVLTTPNLASLGRRIFLFQGRNPLIEVASRPESAGHIRYFVKQALLDLLKENGFETDFFGSDVVTFDIHGKLFSTKLARLFPTFGSRLIVRARKA